jgi:HD-GYP domain-containing protein (c-di-GMP phosphodiesterase class II)
MEENLTAKKHLENNFGFTDTDFEQINSHGISLDKILEQLTIFENGIAKIILDRPAKVDDGILKLNNQEFHKLAQLFDTEKQGNVKLKKFVPASGAATRMFKFLNEFLNSFDKQNESINAYINRKKNKNLPVFLAGIEKFPFYDTVKTRLKELYPNYYSLQSHEKSYLFIKTMLCEQNFNFANKPKGALDFHKYTTHTATPIEEHLNECAHYASANNCSNLHFTISENHQELFEKIILEVKEKVEKKLNTKTEVNFSYQDKSTDTIAVDLNNQPYRTENNQLLFRPGGHGALINNLNQLNADIIFIKGVDNVIQNHIDEIALYKKALAGKLIELQKQIYTYL